MSAHFLLVLNGLSEDEEDRIVDLASYFSASYLSYRLDLLYVKPSIPFYLSSGCQNPASLLKELESESNRATQQLEHYAGLLACDVSRQWIATGFLRQESRRLAKRLGASTVLFSQRESQPFSRVLNHVKHTQAPRMSSLCDFSEMYISRKSTLCSNFSTRDSVMV